MPGFTGVHVNSPSNKVSVMTREMKQPNIGEIHKAHPDSKGKTKSTGAGGKSRTGTLPGGTKYLSVKTQGAQGTIIQKREGKRIVAKSRETKNGVKSEASVVTKKGSIGGRKYSITKTGGKTVTTISEGARKYEKHSPGNFRKTYKGDGPWEEMGKIPKAKPRKSKK